MTSAKSGRGASAFPPGKAFVGDLANAVQGTTERRLVLVAALVFVTRLLEADARLALFDWIFRRALRYGAVTGFSRRENASAEGLGIHAIGQADNTLAIIMLRFPQLGVRRNIEFLQTQTLLGPATKKGSLTGFPDHVAPSEMIIVFRVGMIVEADFITAQEPVTGWWTSPHPTAR